MFGASVVWVMVLVGSNLDNHTKVGSFSTQKACVEAVKKTGYYLYQRDYGTEKVEEKKGWAWNFMCIPVEKP